VEKKTAVTGFRYCIEKMGLGSLGLVTRSDHGGTRTVFLLSSRTGPATTDFFGQFYNPILPFREPPDDSPSLRSELFQLIWSLASNGGRMLIFF